MHTPTIKRAGWAVITLLIVLIGCKKSTDMATPASQECQLQSEIINGGPQATTYTYNENGQLVKRVTPSSSGTPSTYTYAYDAAGNVISALSQINVINNNFTVTGTYEYTDGRLTKIVSKSSSSILASTTDSYSYDAHGRIATYSYSSTDQQYGTESYTFTNGLLTSGAITRGGQSLTVTVENGRIASIDHPDGRKSRNTYDAKGYLTRTDNVDKSGALLSYTTNEYSTTAYKRANAPYQVVPAINLYGNTELPLARGAVYNADGSLKAETQYQYQVNSKGYITTLSSTQNQPGVGNGQSTTSIAYTYGNCQ
ncbi:MAG: hypothetical protein EOO39_10505 [Cytophagaceae bacterium]|nr:MAG: hypothetical protein EOO39_10505 [Cytophagaceae bacterium]